MVAVALLAVASAVLWRDPFLLVRGEFARLRIAVRPAA